MIKDRVSVLIPSRNERWLSQTLADIFGKAAGDVEAVICHDGAWPAEMPDDHPKLVQFNPGRHVGMRAGINMAARISTGEYLMKLDGHCQLAEGYDEVLKADCDDDWVVVPRRKSIEVGTPDEPKWELREDKIVDYHYLSYPFLRKGDVACGLHGNVWKERARDRAHCMIDKEMSSQGSCYFGKREFVERVVLPLDDERYGTFASEMQEVGLKVWKSGGQLMVNKKTWYGHVHKGKAWGTGYQFNTEQWKEWQRQTKKGHDQAIVTFFQDEEFAKWLLKLFWPVPEWPVTFDGQLDWEKVMIDYHDWQHEVLGTVPPMSWLETKGAA